MSLIWNRISLRVGLNELQIRAQEQTLTKTDARLRDLERRVAALEPTPTAILAERAPGE
jgi:cell division protein FtsB